MRYDAVPASSHPSARNDENMIYVLDDDYYFNNEFIAEKNREGNGEKNSRNWKSVAAARRKS